MCVGWVGRSSFVVGGVLLDGDGMLCGLWSRLSGEVREIDDFDGILGVIDGYEFIRGGNGDGVEVIFDEEVLICVCKRYNCLIVIGDEVFSSCFVKDVENVEGVVFVDGSEEKVVRRLGVCCVGCCVEEVGLDDLDWVGRIGSWVNGEDLDGVVGCV